MNELVLTGLDGKNPLGFLTALGVLTVLDVIHPGVRLCWRCLDTYRPVLLGAPDLPMLVEALVADVARIRADPALALHYEKEDGKPAHDLKPKPLTFAGHLLTVRKTEVRASIALVAGFATDVVVDNNGNTKPTALHFTAGQQEFLAMATDLAEAVAADDFREALMGPWRYARPTPVMGWDNSASRDYALRASDPSKDKKLGVPGADWLALRGLASMSVVPTAEGVATPGCSGGWKTGAFRWPLWTAPIGRASAAALLTSPEIADVDPVVLRARGIDVVLEAGIRRSEQGGYGSFSPAHVAETLSKPRRRSRRAREA